MSALQAFFLGMMVALMPSLVVLAWLLWKAPLEESLNAGTDASNERLRRTGSTMEPRMN